MDIIDSWIAMWYVILPVWRKSFSSRSKRERTDLPFVLVSSSLFFFVKDKMLILTGWEVSAISWISTRPSKTSCTSVRAIPSTNMGWADNGWRLALGRSLWMEKSMWLYNGRLHSEKKTHPGLYQKKCEQQVKRGDSVSLLCTCETPPGILCPGLECPQNKGL